MEENRKYYTEMSSNEFRVAVGTDSNLIHAVKGDDWAIYKDTHTERYFYIDLTKESDTEFHEVTVVARLTHIDTIIMDCDIDTLVDMFDDFDYVGQEDDAAEVSITYTWFKKI